MSQTIVRTPTSTLTLDGVQLTGTLAAPCQVISASCSFGYDQRTSTATIRLSNPPANVALQPLKTKVVLALSDSPQLRAADFEGLLVEVDPTLYPHSIDLLCRGPLVLAEKYTCPPTDPSGHLSPGSFGGLDLSFGGLGDKDENMVRNVLQALGLYNPGLAPSGSPYSDFGVFVGESDGSHPTSYGGGTGTTLGTVAPEQFVWAWDQTGMAFIEQLDEICLGYRTYENAAGSIVRTIVNPYAGSTSALNPFTEGVDISLGTGQETILDAYNQVNVTGYKSAAAASPFHATVNQSNPLLTGLVTYQESSQMVERSASGDPGSGLAAQDVATYLLKQLNRELYKFTLTTPRADTIYPGMTIQILPSATTGVAPRLGLSGYYFVQNVTRGIDQHGAFTQQLVVLGGPGGQGPVNLPPGIDFTIHLETELVVIAGVETTLFTVHCVALPTPNNAPIASYSWSGGGTPSTGTADTFTTVYTSIAGKSITLSVTDSAGLTGTTTKPIPASTGSNYLVRKLYLAGTDTIDDYGITSAWAVHAQTAALVVANGPLWQDGSAALASTNDLATAPTSTTPFAAGTVSALWVETNVNASALLAGSSLGHIAYSIAGSAWVDKGIVPDGNPILKCLISGRVPTQWFALTSAHLYRSDNAGSGWVVVQAAQAGEIFEDWVLSFARGMIAMSGGRLLIDLAGNTQTFPGGTTGPIVAVTADIRTDRFYCYDSSGNTYGHANGGDVALVALTALNLGGGSAQTRGLWRDGTARGLLYYAAGAGGAWKSLDGFGSSGGYYQVRKPGVGSSPAGAVYTQIGADGLLYQPPATPQTLSSSLSAVCLNLYNDTTHASGPSPTGWQLQGFNDSSWVTPVTANVIGPSAPVPGTTPLWPTVHPDPDGDTHGSTETVLFRVHVTISGAPVRAAILQFIADSACSVWINGIFIGRYNYYVDGVPIKTVTIDPSVFVLGDNIIAFQGDNLFPNGPVPPTTDAAWVSYQIALS